MVWDHEVAGSRPVTETSLWGISSSGRAVALQAIGDRFESDILHQVLWGHDDRGLHVALAMRTSGIVTP